MSGRLAARTRTIVALSTIGHDAYVIKSCACETRGVMAGITLQRGRNMVYGFSTRRHAVVTA